VRAGTIDLYAAIDIRTGKVITSLSPTHAAPDFIQLMKKVVAAYLGKKVHVVLDNATVHTSAETTGLAPPGSRASTIYTEKSLILRLGYSTNATLYESGLSTQGARPAC
jgi:DDE superfamily endonuclease